MDPTATVRRSADAIDVSSPAPHARFQLLILLSWVVLAIPSSIAVVVMVGSMGSMLAKGQYVPGILFPLGSVIVFCGFLAGAVSALFGMFGREDVHIGLDGITTFHSWGPFRYRQEYPPPRIRNIRVYVPEPGVHNWSPPPSRVVFDTPGRIKGFGGYLTQQQAAEVASTALELMERVPTYGGNTRGTEKPKG